MSGSQQQQQQQQKFVAMPIQILNAIVANLRKQPYEDVEGLIEAIKNNTQEATVNPGPGGDAAPPPGQAPEKAMPLNS